MARKSSTIAMEAVTIGARAALLRSATAALARLLSDREDPGTAAVLALIDDAAGSLFGACAALIEQTAGHRLRKCAHCDAAFVAKDVRARYCSDTCKVAASRERTARATEPRHD